MLLLRHHPWHHHLALLLALLLCAVDLESLVSGKSSSIFVGAADQNNEAAQGEDSEEVERILSAPRCKLWNDLAASIGFEQDLILMNANKSEVH